MPDSRLQNNISGTTLKELQINNAEWAVRIQSSNNNVIDNVKFSNNHRGVYAYLSDNTTIAGCVVAGSAYQGLIIDQGCDNTTIMGNLITTANYQGLYLEGSHSSVITGNKILTNGNGGWGGICLASNASATAITNNDIYASGNYNIYNDGTITDATYNYYGTH